MEIFLLGDANALLDCFALLTMTGEKGFALFRIALSLRSAQ